MGLRQADTQGRPFGRPSTWSAIRRTLIEASLFGYEKGAFDGATIRHPGRFRAGRGWGAPLFLRRDRRHAQEAQTRLLRVLQEGEYTTVGGRSPIRTNVRIVAATNRDLRQWIGQGLFREDLYFRLNVVPLRLPPLRERKEDIGDLARHFFAACEAEGLPPKRMSPDAVAALQSHRWPGNVRELENLIRRLAALYPEDVITAANIGARAASERPVSARHPAPAGGGSETLQEAVGSVICRTNFTRVTASRSRRRGLYHRIIHADVDELSLCLHAAARDRTRGNQIKGAASSSA